jgi:hypothetical protein
MRAGKGLLTPLQRTFLQAFAELPDQASFYLTGGTALAEFHLGHRLSFDLDLFTGEAGLVAPMSRQVDQLDGRHGLQVTAARRFASYAEFVVAQADEQVKVDLALDAPFHFQPPEPSDAGVWVNSYEDLKVDKVLAYYGRAEPRDAVDLYFLLRQERLDELLELAARKDPGFDRYWFAVALNRAAGFPDELERWPVKLLVPCDPIEIKRTFQTLADDLMRGL